MGRRKQRKSSSKPKRLPPEIEKKFREELEKWGARPSTFEADVRASQHLTATDFATYINY